MLTVRRRIRMLAEERGQAIIMFVGVFTITALLAAISIDFGLWFSERRGAQTDSDLLALAGAWELLDEASTQTDAVNAVNSWLVDNQESGNTSLENVVVDNSCFGIWDLDAVAVDTDHESKALFSSIFGKLAPEIGAHAKACAGAAESPGNNPTLPFETDTASLCFTNGQPNIGQTCILDFGANGAGGSQRGIVDVIVEPDYCSGGGGSAYAIAAMVLGATGTCLLNEGSPPICDPDVASGEWHDCVSSQSGNPQAVREGVQCRITAQVTPPGANNQCQLLNPTPEGDCDALPGGNGDGIDDFSESVVQTGLTSGGQPIYEPRDCDPGTDGLQASPRLGAIFVLPQNPNVNQNDPDPIIGFAGFYILGCRASFTADLPQSTAEKQCNVQPQQGHIAVFGTFVNLITSGGGVGPPNPASTLFGIGLVE